MFSDIIIIEKAADLSLGADAMVTGKEGYPVIAKL